jgi:protease I
MDLARIIQFEAPPTFSRLNTSMILAADENEGFKRFLFEKPANPTLLSGKRFAILSTDGVEELELTVPYTYLQERAATVHLVAPRYEPLPPKYGVQYPEVRRTHILTVRFMENSGWFKIDKFLDEVTTRDYDVLIIPGGAWNPDTLRLNPAAVSFITEMYNTGKLTTAICHGPVMLINTGLLRGKTVTGIWNIQMDLKNAGATVIEQPVVIDDNLITGRSPYDLPQYLEAIVEAVIKAK